MDFFAGGLGFFSVGDRAARSVVECTLRDSRHGERRSDCHGYFNDELFWAERQRRACHQVQGVEDAGDQYCSNDANE